MRVGSCCVLEGRNSMGSHVAGRATPGFAHKHHVLLLLDLYGWTYISLYTPTETDTPLQELLREGMNQLTAAVLWFAPTGPPTLMW